ncbi:hypothetical protein Pmani_034862 [Petrolisthes manimaculis]|uniref:C-factor n=1 Tax=Petrolisthes manimaculis TaxID=1843537 RepID=A0AAE1TP91_9EUCA|nr:hypothetical protein Pmani_034862 [Petrolisthes manimaculis]
MVARSLLITGSNRGLGLEMVRQLVLAPRTGNPKPEVLIATCRSPHQAQELCEVADNNKNVHVMQLDVTDESSYGSFVSRVGELVGPQGLNLLVNNAGVAPKSTRINMVRWQQVTDTLTVNTVAPIMLTKALLPHLKTAANQVEGDSLAVKRAAVINISSVLGSIARNEQGGLYPYRASKAALNAITKSMSVDLRGNNILVASLHPGWVQTDMGGKNADLTPTDSISQILNLLRQMTDHHHGQFYQYDGEQVPW